MHNDRLDQLTDYAFTRLRRLLDGVPPGDAVPLDMALGEPRHPPPDFIRPILGSAEAEWGRYPPGAGTPELRQAIADWLDRRYALPAGLIDPDRHIVPVCGTREALFLAALAAVPARGGAVLLPNPFYQAYLGGAVMAGAEAVLLDATPANGFQPDLAALDPALLDRAALVYLNSPANPQGSVLSRAQLKTALDLARAHDFVLAVDECYAEIYTESPPPGALEAAAETGSLENLLVFHSLSKRSNVPGLRSGFVAGDADLIALTVRLRAYGGATLPLPVMQASAALWRDEEHVAENRRLYREKFDAALELFDVDRPAGGFFLWLDVADGEAAATTLWHEAGVRVLPGAYMARESADGGNPGDRYIRVALVHAPDETRAALTRAAAALAA